MSRNEKLKLKYLYKENILFQEKIEINFKSSFNEIHNYMKSNEIV